MKNNKEADNDWFRLESNTEGTRWWGKAWTIQDMLRYEFDIEFDVHTTMNKKSSSLLIDILFLLDTCYLSNDSTGNSHT